MFRFLPFVICLSAFSCLCQAQDLHSLLPWIKLNERIQIGMKEEVLRAIYPALKPMSGVDSSARGKAQPSEMYFDPEHQILGTEDVAFGVKNGVLTKFYWSSSARIDPSFVKQTRASLRSSLGEPRVGYKARLTKDQIAKVTTEVFSPSAFNNIVITLSSSLGTTEVEVINIAAEEVTAEEMYFSYEKQKQALQAQLAGLTGKAPEEAPADATNDLLANSDESSSNGALKTVAPLQELGSPTLKTSSPPTITKTPSEEPTSSTLWSVIVILMVAATGLLWLLVKKRK